MNAPATNLPAERQQQHPLVKLDAQLASRADEFKKALPDHITPQKLQRTIMTAAQNNPDLLTADRQSLITSAMKAAQDGLLPDGREAALVIFNTREKGADGQWYSKKLCQYMPMVYGLRKKIVQSGEIVSLQTGLVYRAEMEAGAFLYEVGLEPPIRHRPMLDLPEEEVTDDKIVAAYSMAKMKDGTVSVEVMRRADIDKVRMASQTGSTKDRYGKDRVPKGPWVDWFGEMARKTVMRRHSKTLPMSGDIIMDVEGRDQDAAASAARILEVEPDAPLTLPPSEEIDDAAGETKDQDEPNADRLVAAFDVAPSAAVLDALRKDWHEQMEAGALERGENEDIEDAFNRACKRLGLDPETGEVIQTDSRGMTEVDEETARRLDAGEQDQDERDPEDLNVGDDSEAEDDKPAWWPKVQWIRLGVPNCKNKQQVKDFDDEFTRIRAGLPDEVIEELDALIAAKRKALTKTAEAAAQ